LATFGFGVWKIEKRETRFLVPGRLCHLDQIPNCGIASSITHVLLPCVQVTSDLAGFWKTSYALVRRDMKGRYPKHHWPEDPSEAEATRLTKKGTAREAAAAEAAEAARGSGHGKGESSHLDLGSRGTPSSVDSKGRRDAVNDEHYMCHTTHCDMLVNM
jgi:hypothetical protein